MGDIYYICAESKSYLPVKRAPTKLQAPNASQIRSIHMGGHVCAFLYKDGTVGFGHDQGFDILPLSVPIDFVCCGDRHSFFMNIPQLWNVKLRTNTKLLLFADVQILL